MSFGVELWDKDALHIRWAIAASGSAYLAHAAFDDAVKQYPAMASYSRASIPARARNRVRYIPNARRTLVRDCRI
jgi:hypothetical protein